MDVNYRKYVLQFDLSLIYWLVKYKLIKPTEYVNKLILSIDQEDILKNSIESKNEKIWSKTLQIYVFKAVLGKWMSLICPWKDSNLNLNEEDYNFVKNSIKRAPNGLLGLKKDVALVSPLIHNLDFDYRNNRHINEGPVPLHSYLTDSDIALDKTSQIDNKTLDFLLLDAEKIWKKIFNFLKNVSEIKGLNDYIEKIDLLSSKEMDLPDMFLKVEKLLPYLKPFPTICYLVGLESNKKISELEGKGLITTYQELLQSDKKLMERFIQENFHCFISRFRLVHIDIVIYLYTALINSIGFVQVISEVLDIENIYLQYDIPSGDNKNLKVLNSLRRYGIGGINNWCRVKCLHSLYAYSTFFELTNSVSLDFINSNI